MDANKTWGMTQAMMAGDFNPNHDPDDGRFTSGGGSGKSASESKSSAKDPAKMTEKEIIAEISKHDAEARAAMNNHNKTKAEAAASRESAARAHELRKELDRRWAAGEKAHGINGGFENAVPAEKGSKNGSKSKTAYKDVSSMSEKDIRSEISELRSRMDKEKPWNKMTKQEQRETQEIRVRSMELQKELDKRWGAAERAHGIKGGFENAGKSSGKGKRKTSDSAWDITERMMVGDFNPYHDPDDGRFTSGSGGSAQTASASETSTHGKIVDQGGGQWYGENDDGSSVSILDGGKEDINLWKYGSRQIYEVQPVDKDLNWGEKEYYATKKEAMAAAKKHLAKFRGNAPASKMKDPAGYFNQASKMSGLKPVLAQMDKASKDNVAKAVYRAAASPDGRDATLSFGRKSVKVTTPSKDKHVAKQYGIHWTDRRGIPNASMHGEAKDLATHLLITLKDLGYNGEQITIK